MSEDVIRRIEGALTPFIQGLSLEIVSIDVKHRGKILAVEILADRPAGGITIDECSRINRFIVQEIEEKNLISEDYVVEVSSPGLDRPLTTHKDFLRVMGRMVRFHLREAVENKVEHSGTVEEVKEDGVKIHSKFNLIEIPFNKINKAVQVI